jgi:hypothetical protein
MAARAFFRVFFCAAPVSKCKPAARPAGKLHAVRKASQTSVSPHSIRHGRALDLPAEEQQGPAQPSRKHSRQSKPTKAGDSYMKHLTWAPLGAMALAIAAIAPAQAAEQKSVAVTAIVEHPALDAVRDGVRTR